MRGAPKFRPGDRVTVRPLGEILRTLDGTGALEGLPFLPEMVKYCGRTFTVRRRVEKLIQEGVGSSLRRIRNAVLLEDTICDGRAHGDCRRACFPLWKTAWLAGPGLPPAGRPAASPAPASLPSRRGCQVTDLMRATTPLRVWDPIRYILDVTSRTYSLREYAAYVLGALYRKTVKRLAGTGRKAAAPAEAFLPGDLGLRPGDIVEVRSAAEIRATLDAEGKCRGLYFMPGMWAHCGRRFRVLHPVERMMSERTGEMRALSRTVILEGVTCDGKANGGCQRGCLAFWKDAWLRRCGEE
ncbi:MAG: hypothetical protein ABFD52_02140 [Acidobacteriota bacterium]